MLLDVVANNDQMRTVIQDLYDEFLESGILSSFKLLLLPLLHFPHDLLQGSPPKNKLETVVAIASYNFALACFGQPVIFQFLFTLSKISPYLPPNLPVNDPIIASISILGFSLCGFVAGILASLAVSDVELPGTVLFVILFATALIVHHSTPVLEPHVFFETLLPFLFFLGIGAAAMKKARYFARRKLEVV